MSDLVCNPEDMFYSCAAHTYNTTCPVQSVAVSFPWPSLLLLCLSSSDLSIPSSPFLIVCPSVSVGHDPVFSFLSRHLELSETKKKKGPMIHNIQFTLKFDNSGLSFLYRHLEFSEKKKKYNDQ